MIWPILLIVVLLIAALLLFAAEVCTPSFGMLGLGGAGCLAWMLHECFKLSPILGVAMVVALIFIVPTYLWLAVKYLPKTAIGQMLQLRVRKVSPGEGTPESEALEGLVGRTAVAETPLRPSGAVRIDGRRVIATAQAGFIEQGAAVRVIGAAGTNVVVEKAGEQE